MLNSYAAKILYSIQFSFKCAKEVSELQFFACKTTLIINKLFLRMVLSLEKVQGEIFYTFFHNGDQNFVKDVR